MIAIESRSGRFLAPNEAACPPEARAPLVLEDLFRDPDVCRRVGAIIAKAARPPPTKPEPG
jgi:hypothetical protein